MVCLWSECSFSRPRVKVARPGVKVSLGGSVLVYSTLIYVGPSSRTSSAAVTDPAPSEAGQAIAVDSGANAYLTKSGPSDFPTTVGAFQAVAPGAPPARLCGIRAGG